MTHKKILAVAACALLAFIFLVPGPKRTRLTQPATPPSPTQAPSLNLSYPCQPGRTAFELLQTSAEIKFETSSYGKMVTAINGVRQGNGKYWLYSIDDKEASVGADSYRCQSTEQIRWQLK